MYVHRRYNIKEWLFFNSMVRQLTLFKMFKMKYYRLLALYKTFSKEVGMSSHLLHVLLHLLLPVVVGDPCHEGPVGDLNPGRGRGAAAAAL